MLRRFSVDFAIFSMLADAGLVMLALRLAVVLRPTMIILCDRREVIGFPLHARFPLFHKLRFCFTLLLRWCGF